MKLLKHNNFKRGDKVICLGKNKREEYRGVIARIALSKDIIYIIREDGRRTFEAPIIKGKRTWSARRREDGSWDGYPGYYKEADKFYLYFDSIDDWRAVMTKELA